MYMYNDESKSKCTIFFLSFAKSVRCPQPWHQFGESCYAFSLRDAQELSTPISERLTWQEVKEACKSVGASLLILNSPEEYGNISASLGEMTQSWLGCHSLTSGSAEFFCRNETYYYSLSAYTGFWRKCPFSRIKTPLASLFQIYLEKKLKCVIQEQINFKELCV